MRGRASDAGARVQGGEKIFGAPPKQMRRESEASILNRQSGIPTKKTSKADKSSALVVCSAQNGPTAYEKQNLISDRSKNSNSRNSNRDFDDDEDFVFTTDNIRASNTPDSEQKRFQPRGRAAPSPKINDDALDGDEGDEPVEIVYNHGRRSSGTPSRKVSTSSRRRSSNNTQNSIQIEQEMDEDEDEDDGQSRSTQRSVTINKNDEENEDATEHSHRHHRRHSRSGRSHRRHREDSYADEQNAENTGKEGELEAGQNASEEEEQFEDEQVKPKSILKKNSAPNTPVKDDKADIEEETKVNLFEGILDQLASVQDSAMSKISQWQRHLLNLLTPLEEQQLQRWYLLTTAYLEQQGITHDEKSLEFREELDAIVEVIMQKHGFTTLQGVLHRMRVFITGPRKSGKSTLLSLTAQRALIELAAGSEWKHTFVFAYDFASNSHTVHDVAEMYKTFVRATFAGLSAQRPLLSEHAAALSKAFCDIVDGNPLLPKSFTASNDFRLLVPALNNLITIIQECLRVEDKSVFIANAVAFPQLVSQIFGFDRVLVIADHFDSFAAEMTPAELYVVENVKILLNTSNFICAAQDQQRAAECMKPADIDGVDITQSICKLSTLDVVNEDPFDGTEYTLTVENNPRKLQISFPLFGGCAAFLVMWRELNELSQKFEAAQGAEDDQGEDAEEIEILLVNKATDIFNALTEGTSDVVVTAVNKMHKK